MGAVSTGSSLVSRLSLASSSWTYSCVTAFCLLTSHENMSLKPIWLLSFSFWTRGASAGHVIRPGSVSGCCRHTGQARSGLYNSLKSDLMPDIVLERSRNNVDISFLENKGLLKYGWISSSQNCPQCSSLEALYSQF